MVYTTYLDRLSELPNDSLKIVIMRYQPKVNLFEFENVKFVKCLSPSDILLTEYKTNKITFKEFSEKFKNELKNNLESTRMLSRIKNCKRDVYLICCEKSPLECHRSIIADILKNQGCNCKEF